LFTKGKGIAGERRIFPLEFVSRRVEICKEFSRECGRKIISQVHIDPVIPAMGIQAESGKTKG
jgi:hypothetical protein